MVLETSLLDRQSCAGHPQDNCQQGTWRQMLKSTHWLQGWAGACSSSFLCGIAVLLIHSPEVETLVQCLLYRSYVYHTLLRLRIRPKLLDHRLIAGCNLKMLSLTLALNKDEPCTDRFKLCTALVQTSIYQ